ncbi:MAG TPA: FAD-dependent oxidoreductase [Rhodothermales bacterium]
MTGTLSFWQFEGREVPREADFLVVGAGITGASTAWWIRQRAPDARIVLIDRGSVAAGASGRNAGFLLRGTVRLFSEEVREVGLENALRIHRFTTASIRSMLEALDGLDFSLRKSGSLLAAGDEEEDGLLRESVRLLRESDEAVEYWSPETVAERTPAVGFSGGMYDPEGATVNPVRLVGALVNGAYASVATGVSVRRVTERDGHLVVETDGPSLRARRVVLGLNAHLPQVDSSLRRYVRPVRAQMLAGRPARGFNLDLPVYSHYGYFYVRMAPDGAFLVGGARHLHRDEEVGYDDATTPSLQSDLEAYARRHFPSAGALEVTRRWSGTMGFSPDGLPVIGRSDNGAIWAGGFTGHGMAFGFGIGRMLASLAMDEDPGPEAQPFLADRFGP